MNSQLSFVSPKSALLALGFAVGLGTMVSGTPAQALTCSANNGLYCTSFTTSQWGGTFSPGNSNGGFGGAASCTVTHTPVVFVHGNGDSAASFAQPPANVPGYTTPPASVYQALLNAGYKDCEIFGVNYLNSSERSASELNYHQESKYTIINNFISKVKSYTGAAKVDIVSHSLGVTMSIAALKYGNNWGSVRRFINISGGLRGLESCYYVGYANAYATTCGSQNIFDSYIFGFYPDADLKGINSWTATAGLPKTAINNPGVSFYTINAGTHDEIMCATVTNYSTCGNSPLFTAASNVLAQLNVGAGDNTQSMNWSWVNGMPLPAMLYGGDTNGVGHFIAKNNTGSIIVQMLTTSCTGIGCASTYTYGPVVAQ